MKAEDLKIPFTFAERRAIIMNRLWYVPERVPLDNFTFPGWSDETLFGSEKPIHIEYCSGNGAWILKRAAAHPDVNFLAVEQRFDRSRKIWVKLHNMNLNNLVVAWAEGHLLTKTFIPAQSVQEISVNFPDPWPKRKHEKNRIIQKQFLDEAARILKPDGTITVVTDDATYSQQIIAEFTAHTDFTNAFATPFIEPGPDYGTSFFDELWRMKGKTIRLHRFVRRA